MRTEDTTYRPYHQNRSINWCILALRKRNDFEYNRYETECSLQFRGVLSREDRDSMCRYRSSANHSTCKFRVLAALYIAPSKYEYCQVEGLGYWAEHQLVASWEMRREPAISSSTFVQTSFNYIPIATSHVNVHGWEWSAAWIEVLTSERKTLILQLFRSIFTRQHVLNKQKHHTFQTNVQGHIQSLIQLKNQYQE